jgi:hypothetical protein
MGSGIFGVWYFIDYHFANHPLEEFSHKGRVLQSLSVRHLNDFSTMGQHLDRTHAAPPGRCLRGQLIDSCQTLMINILCVETLFGHNVHKFERLTAL